LLHIYHTKLHHNYKVLDIFKANIPGSDQACIHAKVNLDFWFQKTRSWRREKSCWTTVRRLLLLSGWPEVRWIAPSSRKYRVQLTGRDPPTSRMEDRWLAQSESERHPSEDQTPLCESCRQPCYPTHLLHIYRRLSRQKSLKTTSFSHVLTYIR